MTAIGAAAAAAPRSLPALVALSALGALGSWSICRHGGRAFYRDRRLALALDVSRETLVRQPIPGCPFTIAVGNRLAADLTLCPHCLYGAVVRRFPGAGHGQCDYCGQSSDLVHG